MMGSPNHNPFRRACVVVVLVMLAGSCSTSISVDTPDSRSDTVTTTTVTFSFDRFGPEYIPVESSIEPSPDRCSPEPESEWINAEIEAVGIDTHSLERRGRLVGGRCEVKVAFVWSEETVIPNIVELRTLGGSYTTDRSTFLAGHGPGQDWIIDVIN